VALVRRINFPEQNEADTRGAARAPLCGSNFWLASVVG
jgi:hypothetical protein